MCTVASTSLVAARLSAEVHSPSGLLRWACQSSWPWHDWVGAGWIDCLDTARVSPIALLHRSMLGGQLSPPHAWQGRVVHAWGSVRAAIGQGSATRCRRLMDPQVFWLGWLVWLCACLRRGLHQVAAKMELELVCGVCWYWFLNGWLWVGAVVRHA